MKKNDNKELFYSVLFFLFYTFKPFCYICKGIWILAYGERFIQKHFLACGDTFLPLKVSHDDMHAPWWGLSLNLSEVLLLIPKSLKKYTF